MKIDAKPNVSTITMPRRLFRKWLQALRSGEYIKATNKLVNIDGTEFCCLGVLANEQGCTWGYDGDGFAGPVPKGQRQQRGTSFLGRTLGAGIPLSLQKQLAEFNDLQGGAKHSHAEIADWLEANITPAK